MTSAMSNAILEYAKLAGQLDCKTNQQLNKIAAASKGLTKQSAAVAAAQSTNRRKREFASLDEGELNGNLLDTKPGKPVEKGIDGLDCKLSETKPDQKQEGTNMAVIKEKKDNLEAAKAGRKGNLSSGAKQHRRAGDGDIGKLSEQLDNLQSDLQFKTKSEENDEPLKENGVEDDVEDEDYMPNDDLHSAGGLADNEKLMNGLQNGDLVNDDCLEDEDEYPTKMDDSAKDGEKDQTDFNSFYNTNRINDKHSRTTGKYRPSSKRLLIRNLSKEFGQQPTGSLNSHHRSSSSSSPNDGSLQGNTAALSTMAASSGNDSYSFEDNLADENRCSSTTSINSNNGLAGRVSFC